MPLPRYLLITLLAGGLPLLGLSAARADFVTIKGVKIHYTVQGNGTPVVLIHGMNVNSTINWGLPGIITLLSQNHKVIAVDLPGHGKSDRPQYDSAYGLQMEENILGVLDNLGIRKAHIVGYSLGSVVAMKFLVKHQDRVLSGVLCAVGWLKPGSGCEQGWEKIPGSRFGAPEPCQRLIGELAVTKEEILTVHVPVEIFVGGEDPNRMLTVAPLRLLREDWPLVTVPNAGHINAMFKPEFKNALKEWLDRH